MPPLHLMPPAPPGRSRMEFLNMFEDDDPDHMDTAPSPPESEEATVPFVCILLRFHIFSHSDDY